MDAKLELRCCLMGIFPYPGWRWAVLPERNDELLMDAKLELRCCLVGIFPYPSWRWAVLPERNYELCAVSRPYNL